MQILRIVVCTAYSKINLNGKWRVRAIFKDSCLSTCKYTCNGVRANPTARSEETGDFVAVTFLLECGGHGNAWELGGREVVE